MKNITSLFLLLFLMLSALPSPAWAKGMQKDSVQVKLRLPSAKSVNKFKQDKDFQYNRGVSYTPSLWERFLNWLSRLFRVKRGSFAAHFINRYVWYILFGAVLIFIIFSLFRAEITGLFSRAPAQAVRMEALNEDIHAIDFDSLIQDAVKQKNFRYAVRLYYLKSLKLLADQGLIEWKPDKTGRDYQYELSGKGIQEPFASITNLFNWIWYGELPMNEDNFQLARDEFAEFNRQLSR